MRGIDTEQLLADWFHEEAPKQEPPLLLPATLARTAMTRRAASGSRASGG